MGFLNRIGKPGEAVTLLAFGDDFKSVELKKGFTRYAKYLDNSGLMEGVELNGAGPIILKQGDKIKGTVYPVDYDKGQGVEFNYWKETPIKSFKDTVLVSVDKDGKLTLDNSGEGIEREVLVEVYPGIPVKSKTGTGFARVVVFDLDPVRKLIRTNPKLIGHTVASEILSNAIRLKPMRWQIIAGFAFGILVGYLFGGG